MPGVDDDPAVLKALARLLRSLELNVATFASSQEFLEQYDRAYTVVWYSMSPCLISMAWICNRKLADRDIGLPVILLTGHGDIPMSVQTTKQAAVDFFTKPVHENDLIEAIHAAFEKDRMIQRTRAELAEIWERLDTLMPREGRSWATRAKQVNRRRPRYRG
ncbi:response regulator transcription factor [Methyloglobulus sp.]|uniref:response regulator transcription factor n=1 Tax=Methyloglobulus sp. TaxID=2518622 RepID=UPI003988F82D